MPPLAKRISFSLLTALVLWAGIAVTLVRHPPGNILSWDTFGYYLYLPANLLHHDPALQDQQWVKEVMDTYHNTGSFYQAGELPDGRWVMKYPMGLAILWSPFFVVGHIVAGFTGHPQDGFSAPYQWSILWAMLVYALAGLLVLRRVLKEFFGDAIVAAVLFLLISGTNYLHQALYSSGMPHVFLFTLYAGVLWHSIRWHRQHRRRDAIILAILMGLLMLSRPSEIVVVFIPLLIGLSHPSQWKEHLRVLWHWRSHLLLVAGILLLIGAPQLIYWKWLTGKFLYMSYNNPGEGFEFLHPYFAEVLFSFRKGWFIYTPMMAVATGGLFLMRRGLPSLQWSVIVFFLLNLYIVSSWSCWWYADSFGQRSLVQSYAVMALPLGAVIAWLAQQRLLPRIVGWTMLLAIAGLNLFQTWQSREGMIHTSRMTWPAYKALWGHTTVPPDMADLLMVERSYTSEQGVPDLARYRKIPLLAQGFDAPAPGVNDEFRCDTLAFSGSHSFRLLPGNEFTPAIRIPWQQLTEKDHVWLQVSCRVHGSAAGVPALALVTTFEHDGASYAYHAEDLDPSTVATGQWGSITFWYQSPEVRRPDDPLLIYAWLRDTLPAWVDDITVTLYEPKEQR